MRKEVDERIGYHVSASADDHHRLRVASVVSASNREADGKRRRISSLVRKGFPINTKLQLYVKTPGSKFKA